jgi:hypothetical protein
VAKLRRARPASGPDRLVLTVTADEEDFLFERNGKFLRWAGRAYLVVSHRFVVPGRFVRVTLLEGEPLAGETLPEWNPKLR